MYTMPLAIHDAFVNPVALAASDMPYQSGETLEVGHSYVATISRRDIL